MTIKPKLTIDDIARELGVSKTTVSRAISGKGRISADTRERILSYIEKTNYRPSAAAKSLAESKTYNIALVLPKSLFKLDIPFIRKSMTAICEEAFLQDYSILLCLSTDDNTAPLLRTLDNRKVDGVILSRTVENDVLVNILNERGIPFATMGSLPKQYRGLATVEADHDQVGGCYAFSMAYFQNLQGKAALLGNDMNYIVNQSRLTGVRQAIEMLKLSQEQIEFCLGLSNTKQCTQTFVRLLEDGVRCFLAMDDDICQHLLIYCQEHGLRIPQDVQIASLYDSDYLRNYDPPIASLSFDAAALGRVTCRELLHYLRDEEYDPKPLLGYRLL